MCDQLTPLQLELLQAILESGASRDVLVQALSELNQEDVVLVDNLPANLMWPARQILPMSAARPMLKEHWRLQQPVFIMY